MNRKLELSHEPDGRVRLSGRCVVTGKPYSVVTSLEGVVAYFEHGRNIGEAFPDLPKPEREFLISGTSPEGWIRLFGRPKHRGFDPGFENKEHRLCRQRLLPEPFWQPPRSRKM